MDAVVLKPGWLEKQIEETQAEVKSWPAKFQVKKGEEQAAEGETPNADSAPAETTDCKSRESE